MRIGFETEAFAICDTFATSNPRRHTILIARRWATARHDPLGRAKGHRAALPHASK